MLIRSYEVGDLDQCRALNEELVVHHRRIYDAPHIGGDEPGLGFDEYLARPDRIATWVAIDNGGIVGLTGLLWHDDTHSAEVEPVIVTEGRRGQGIGRRLMEHAIEEARTRGAEEVNIRPVARNASAIRAFHELGFRTLGHLDLFLRFDDRADWRDGIEVHGRDFRH